MDRQPRYTREELTITFADSEFGRTATIVVPAREWGWVYGNSERTFVLKSTEKMEHNGRNGKPMTIIFESLADRELGTNHGAFSSNDIEGVVIEEFVDYLNELLTILEVRAAIDGVEAGPRDEDSYDTGLTATVRYFEASFGPGPRNWRESWQAVKDYVTAIDMVIAGFGEE